MTGQTEQRLLEAGITLPPAAAPVAAYVPAVLSGQMLYISGQLPMQNGAPAVRGILGAGVTLEQGAEAARICALNILAQAKMACDGDLDRIRRLVKLTGFVAAAPDFADHPKVVNGASELMITALGPAGRHARSAVGVASLPLGAAVEVEAIFELA
jgi:enamine deaminase RidA (YjgF/YER057c/UK114 family)